MAKKQTKVGPEPPVEETPPAETPPVEAPPPEVPEVVVVDETVAEAAAQKQGLDDFLKDEADDLDEEVVPVEEKPPEGQKPTEKVVEETPPAEAPPAVAETPPAEPKPGEAPPPPTPVEAKPEQPPPTAPSAVPAAQPPDPVAPAPTMEQIRETYQKNRGEMEANVASTVYNLSEDQVQRLDDGDAALIPELMAKVYMDAVTGAVAHMITHLPSMMESVLVGRDDTKVLEDQFYTSNPHIDRAQHAETVGRFGLAYRHLYPNAPAEDFIRDVGAQVMVALKIPPGDGGQPALDVPAPKTPAFQPAKSGSPGGTAPPPANPFEVLAEEMSIEDLDLD